MRGPYPGAAREGEAGAWTLRVDARCWPIEVGDTITDGTLTWVVASRRLATVVGHPDVDHVAVQAELEPPQVP